MSDAASKSPVDNSVRASLRALRLGFSSALAAAPGRMAAVAFLRTTTEFTAPVQAWGLKLLTDAVVARDAGAAGRAALLVATALVLSDAMSWLYLGMLIGLRERVGHEMDRRLVDLALRVPGIEHYERPDYQDELSLLRGGHSALANVPDAAMGIAALVVRATITIGLLAALHPLLALLPLFGVPSIFLGARAERIREKMREATTQRTRMAYWLYATATEPKHGKELRVFGVRKPLLGRHDVLSGEVTSEAIRTTVRTSALSGAGWLVFGVGFVAAIAFVALRAAEGRATPGDVVLVGSLAAQINGQLSGAVSGVGFLMRTLHFGRRYLWLSDYARAATAALRPSAPAPPPPVLRDGIRLERVSFRYPGTDVDVLRDVDIHLPAGSTVAIVGDNGAGKSTLVKLLCRFYEPTTGRVTVDGVPLRDIDPEAWRERMSAGYQDFARFELQARESVGVGYVPDAENETLVGAALQRASAGDVVDDLPSGLETQLGRTFEGGVELSGGQWQKIALGRAMMREHPLLLVLDEPTSSLDAKTEHALFERYAGAAERVGSEVGGITVLVSHRFSTVRMADLIVVVRSGGLAEVGTHDELMQRGGLYAELYELQARAYR